MNEKRPVEFELDDQVKKDEQVKQVSGKKVLVVKTHIRAGGAVMRMN